MSQHHPIHNAVAHQADKTVTLEAITRRHYRQHGRHLCIDYGVHSSPFGDLFVAITPRGVCRAAFVDTSDVDQMLAELKSVWSLSPIQHNRKSTGRALTAVLDKMSGGDAGWFSLHVQGSDFQLAVWRALLNIPPGKLASYTEVAAAIGAPKAARAVGNAIGANPVALLIPCHRVIQHSGALGGYRWGATKKRMLQVWERRHLEQIN